MTQNPHNNYIGVILVVLGLTIFALPAIAKTNASNSKIIPTTENILCSLGLSCEISSTSNTKTTSGAISVANGVSTPSSSGGIFNFFFGNSRSNQQSISYGALISKTFKSNPISLVRIAQTDSIAGELKADEQIYEIIGGKKHLIPSLDIFMDYGFSPQDVQFISQQELDKYAKVRLIQLQGDKTKIIYYITGYGMLRRVLNHEIIESYGGRISDVVTVSSKELNFYPENKYINLAAAFNGDIYMTDGDSKRYLTPMAIKRMGVKISDATPVNEVEFNAYKIGKPVVF